MTDVEGGLGDSYTIDEIAADCRVSRMTAYRWVNDGELPHFRLGRCIRVRKADYEEFLKARRRDSENLPTE